jgi:hypothetical protein
MMFFNLVNRDFDSSGQMLLSKNNNFGKYLTILG